jgi:hypothetical protein
MLPLMLGMGAGIIGGAIGNRQQNKALGQANQLQQQNMQYQHGTADWMRQNVFNPLSGVAGRLTDPYSSAGRDALTKAQTFDVTGGAGKYRDQLDDLKFNFQFDKNDPTYKWREQQTNKSVNRAAAARGMWNSSAAMRNLRDANMQLQSDELGGQFNRYTTGWGANAGRLQNLFNQSMQMGGAGYNQLQDLMTRGQQADQLRLGTQTNIAGMIGNQFSGAGNQIGSSINQMGQNTAQAGANTANMWGNIGAMPMNYMMLQQLMGGGGSGMNFGGGGSTYQGLGGVNPNGLYWSR